MTTKTFNFGLLSLVIPTLAVMDCARFDDVDEDLEYWVEKVDFTGILASQEKIDAVREVLMLKNYGQWTEQDLQDRHENLKKLLWVAALEIQNQETTEKAKPETPTTMQKWYKEQVEDMESVA